MQVMPSRTFTVDGTTYRTTLLSATVGRGLYLQLVKTLGPALETIGNTKDAPIDVTLLRMISAVVSGLDQAFLDELCEVFGRVTVAPRPGGEDPLSGEAFGVHFAGKYSAMSRWLVECIKANGMIDFLSGILPKSADHATSPPA